MFNSIVSFNIIITEVNVFIDLTVTLCVTLSYSELILCAINKIAETLTHVLKQMQKHVNIVLVTQFYAKHETVLLHFIIAYGSHKNITKRMATLKGQDLIENRLADS